MQILPQDDDFAAGTPASGQFICLYFGCVATTSLISGIWLPDGAAFVARPIHGAYQSTDARGIHDYNAAFHSSGTANRTVSGAIFRRPFGADVTVTGTFEMRALAGGVPGIGDLSPRGVLARVSAGTLAGDGTADVRLENVDGYLGACYQKASDSTMRIGIFRVKAGALALVGAESIALPTTPPVDLTKLATLTMLVSGTGATVTLVLTLKGFGSGQGVTISRSDTDANRIVAAGRCGFVMGPDRIISGKTTVDLCHLLAVDEGGLRLLQDEFRRLSLAGAKQTTIDAAGTVGSGRLSSAYYWDAGTFDGTDTEGAATFTGSKRFKSSASQGLFDNQVTDDDGPSSRVAPGRLLLGQRPADNLFSQHRSVKITLPAAAIPTANTGEVWAGIVLRASQAKPRDQASGTPGQTINNNPNVPGGTGYALVCRAKTSSQVIWQLHRLVNNSHLAIARLTENSPFAGAFPGYGVQFTLDLDVHPRDAADPFGVVEIVCKVNGTALALALVGAPVGISTPVTGKFHDGSTSRIQQNPGEGLITSNGLTSTGSAVNDYDPLFDDWTQGTLTNAVVLDQDQPNVALLPEATASGSALDTVLAPDWSLEMEYDSHEASNPFESGHRQTMPRFVYSATDLLVRRQVFTFRKRGVNATELAALIAHWNAHDGMALGFSFTPPGESTITAHYASELRYRLIEAGAWEVEFEVEQLLP